MEIARILDGNVVDLGRAEDLFPLTSFSVSGPNDEFLEAESCLRVDNQLSFDNRTQKLIDMMPYIDGNVVRTMAVAALTEQELLQRAEAAWKAVRHLRDQKLRETDYILLPDAPFTQLQKDAWIGYRDELRNIPQTQTDPENIIWPDKPAM